MPKKYMSKAEIKELIKINKTRQAIGMKPFEIKWRKCLVCGSEFETYSNKYLCCKIRGIYA